MIYLAGPYVHKTPMVMDERFEALTKAAAHFMDAGKRMYSAITHGHTVNKKMKQVAGCHRFWLDQCYHHVVTAEAVYVLCLDGWDVSTGVRWEIETAWAWKIPVFLVNPDTYELREIFKGDWEYDTKD